MVLVTASSDLVTGVCMALVLGMAGVLVFRATRTRAEDREDEQD